MLKLHKSFNVRKELEKLQSLVKKCRIDITDPDTKSIINKNISICIHNYTLACKQRPEIEGGALLLQILVNMENTMVNYLFNKLKDYDILKKRKKFSEAELSNIKVIHNELENRLYKFFGVFNNILEGKIPLKELEKFILDRLPEEMKDLVKGIADFSKNYDRIKNATSIEELQDLIQEQQEKTLNKDENQIETDKEENKEESKIDISNSEESKEN